MANELNYVNYDFDQLVQQLIDRVKLSDTWKDTYRSGTGQMLIELYAYVANLALFYVERRATEGYIETAQLRSSIINLVRLLNYTPKRNVSATGKLKFTLASPLTKKVFIPKYTECQTNSGVKYLTNEDAVILPGETEIVMSGIQGSIVEISQVANGNLNYEIKIEDTQVANFNLFVYVDGTEWTAVDSFINSVNTSEHYRLIADIDDTIIIRFGNNVFGLSPTSGQTILIRYIKSSGLAGNVYELDKVVTVNSVIYDEDSTAVDNITVTNSDVFLGGDDPESDEEIRYEAPRVFKTGDRAVTKEDYVSILENYPGIATANAWGENEENPPNYNMFNRVKLVILLNEWQFASVTFKQELSDYLYTKSMLTVKYEYINPTVIYVVPVDTIKAERSATLSAVQSAVETVFDNEFVLGDTTKLGTHKRLSDLVKQVELVTGVAHHYLHLEIRKLLGTPFDSTYDYGSYLDLLNVKKNTVNIYVGSDIVAYDDGAGNFTDVSSVYTVTGAVNYTTGYLGVNISPTPPSGDEIYVRYQQDRDGDLIVSANQILRLYDTEIPSITYV
jgi:hypothetical protein